MAFGKKQGIVGLDIGSRTIKVAEIQDSKKGPVLKKFGTSDIHAGFD